MKEIPFPHTITAKSLDAHTVGLSRRQGPTYDKQAQDNCPVCPIYHQTKRIGGIVTNAQVRCSGLVTATRGNIETTGPLDGQTSAGVAILLPCNIDIFKSLNSSK